MNVNGQPITGAFEQSQQYCSGLRDGGYSDWRLPSKKEITTIGGMNPLHAILYYPSSGSLWTSEVDSNGKHFNCSDTGSCDTYTFDGENAICVRRP